MGIRTLLKRIENAEEALKTHSVFSPDCICFPDKEQPFFCLPSEEPIAARVKCPLHGNRFRQPIFHVYVSSWRAEKEPARRRRLSAQYRKAWDASFPEELCPREEESAGPSHGDKSPNLDFWRRVLLSGAGSCVTAWMHEQNSTSPMPIKVCPTRVCPIYFLLFVR